jgi:hypothetical protein
MTKTTALLQWMTNGLTWRTVIDAEGRRFIIHREPSAGVDPRFRLEHVQTPHRAKPIVLRQLRGIQGLREAMRIAQEDWS